MISTSTPLEALFSTLAAIVASFIVRFTARLMLGAQTIGIVSAAARKRCFCSSSKPGRRHDQRQAALQAQRGGRLGPGGQREIDQHVGRRVQGRRQRNAQRGHAGQRSRILAQLRMAGAFQRGDNLQFGIRTAQGNQPPAHASGGSVDGDACFGHRQLCCWMA